MEATLHGTDEEYEQVSTAKTILFGNGDPSKPKHRFVRKNPWLTIGQVLTIVTLIGTCISVGAFIIRQSDAIITTSRLAKATAESVSELRPIVKANSEKLAEPRITPVQHAAWESQVVDHEARLRVSERNQTTMMAKMDWLVDTQKELLKRVK